MRILKAEAPFDRLDRWLAQHLGKTRSQIQKLLRSGEVLVNGVAASASYLLEGGEVIQVPEMPAAVPGIVPEKMALEILFEDAEVIVLNKPAGVIVHPGAGQKTGTLVHGLLAHTQQLSALGGAERLGIVHRLDQFTEGLMVVAKTEAAHAKLAAQFEARTVDKGYYAMVEGSVMADELVIDRPIGRDTRDRKKMAVRQSGGRAARTRLKVLKRYTTKTLVELKPETGRTHQIRVHLASIGHPVLGDPVYLGKKRRGAGQLLQAFRLNFDHPKTGERLRFELPISARLVS